MARRKTKAQLQRSELWQHARFGPYQARDTMNGANQTAGADGSWLRSTHDHFQPSNANNVRVVIDAQHARAQTFGLQTASQFGYGIYDVDIELIPSTQAINPEDGRSAFGEVNVRWIEPTPLRMDALKALKGIEKMEDDIQPFVRDEGRAASANPLLSSALDNANVTLDTTPQQVRGSRIIRYGWFGDSPKVYRQSTISVDLNTDGDTSDNYENQYYVLQQGDQDHFSIMDRMENAVNPLVVSGKRRVETEWAYPVFDRKVTSTSSLRKQVTWALNLKPENSLGTNLPGGIHQQVASFRGCRALGGLIEITIPEFTTQAIGLPPGNNDYELIVNLRCRKWIPMA